MEIKAKLNFNGMDITPEIRESSYLFDDKAEVCVERDGHDVKATLKANAAGEYRLSLSFTEFGSFVRAFIPSVWYRGNHEGEGLFPKEETSRFWSFYEHRMPLPGILIYVTGKGSVLTTIEPSRNCNEFSSVSWNDDGITYEIPGKERPYGYRGKTALVDTSSEPDPSIYLEDGEEYTKVFHVYEYENTDELSVYGTYLREHVHLKPVKSDITWNNYEKSKLVRLLNLTYRDTNGNAYLKMGEGNGEEQNVYEFTSASFLVKSLEAAAVFASIDLSEFEMSSDLENALYRIRDMFGEDCTLKELARKIGDHFLLAESSDGIFRDCEDLTTGEKGGYLGIGEHPEYGYLVNARTNGEAMSGYVSLYEILGNREYLDIARRVSSFYMDKQLPSGSFGRWWSSDGSSVCSSGTNGAYIGVFLLKLYPHLDGEEHFRCRKSILKAVEYYRTLAMKGDFFGDTLDADSCDKEAGISLMSLMLEACEVMGPESEWIEAARKCASFILTWVWHYDEYFSPLSPLGKEDFHTIGMSSVSIAHHHLDFYGMLIAKDFLRLYRLTDDEFYRDEALLMASACKELISWKPGELGRNLYGYQPEQVNHTTWDYFSRKDRMNGTYNIDIAWNNVLGLSSYRYIEKEFPGLL